MNIPELDELYALYRADLYRYLCRLTRDSAAAERPVERDIPAGAEGRGDVPWRKRRQDLALHDCPKRLVRKPAAAAPTASTDELVTAQYLADDTLHTHTETRALLHRRALNCC